MYANIQYCQCKTELEGRILSGFFGSPPYNDEIYWRLQHCIGLCDAFSSLLSGCSSGSEPTAENLAHSFDVLKDELKLLGVLVESQLMDKTRDAES